MRGHAGANLMPVMASNRIGREVSPEGREVAFYGSSFIADWTGTLVGRAGREADEIVTASFDLDLAQEFRRSWGIFRDRRPELYGALATMHEARTSGRGG